VPHRYDPAQAHLHLQVAWSGTPPYMHLSEVRPHTPHVAPDHAPLHAQPHAALNEPPFWQGGERWHAKIKNIKILIPSLSEQESVVRRLDILKIQTQKLETIYRQKLAALNELKQSILQKAFTGQLTSKNC
jgi:hypothetical protein